MRTFMVAVMVASLVGCGGGDKDGATPAGNTGGTGGTGGTKIDSPVVGKWSGEYKQKPLSKLSAPEDRDIVKIALDLKPDGTFTDVDGDNRESKGTYVLDFKENAGTLLLLYEGFQFKFDIKLNGDKLAFSNHRFVKDGKESVPDKLRIEDHELTRVK